MLTVVKVLQRLELAPLFCGVDPIQDAEGNVLRRLKGFQHSLQIADRFSGTISKKARRKLRSKEKKGRKTRLLTDETKKAGGMVRNRRDKGKRGGSMKNEAKVESKGENEGNGVKQKKVQKEKKKTKKEERRRRRGEEAV